MDSTRPIVRATSDTADGFGDDLAVPRLLAYPIPEQGKDVPIISIPKRPPWSATTTPEDLERQEQAAFTSWLNGVYHDFPRERLNFFEHNLEVLFSVHICSVFAANSQRQVWRQVWRTLERADVVVMVVDARIPLFHFSDAIYNYVRDDLKKVRCIHDGKGLGHTLRKRPSSTEQRMP